MKTLSLLLMALLLTCASVFGQSSHCESSNGYRVDSERASIYIEFERLGRFEPAPRVDKKNADIVKGKDLWLKFHNNSCWDVEFLGWSAVDGPDGNILWRVASAGIGSIDYIPVESDGKYVPVEGRGDARVGLTLAPGASLLFPVRKKHLIDHRSIYVEFNYGWERIPAVGLEHRVFYHSE